MYDMCKKVNAKEKMVGWYHSGPKLRASDLEINELFKRYIPNPVLVIIDVKPRDVGIPTDAYLAIEEIHDHLLRDIKDNDVGTLSNQISNQLESLKGLHNRLTDITTYLEKVVLGKLPVNHQILYNLQDIFNLLPNLERLETVKSFAVTTNDEMLVVYLSSLVRAVIALHNLIQNKITNRDEEKKEAGLALGDGGAADGKKGDESSKK
ncbi:26S proteasome non-ATPase regulatory subunit 7 [Obelidium mucronatum]|nr:26S proteasome non-ATPase regulatory subunit 7 [Obelidium mucronatum]